MRCPNRARPDHEEDKDHILRKARLDIYWCEVCGAMLIKSLGYTTLAEAARVSK